MGLVTSGIIFFVVTIIILFLIYKFAKKIFKYALIIFIIFFVASTFFGVNLLQQAKDFNKQFPTSEKLFLLEEDNQIKAAFSGKLTDPTEKPTFMTDEELATINTLYASDDLETLQGDAYLLFVISSDTFNELDEITIAEDTYSREFVLGTINSQDPEAMFVQQIIENENLPNTAETRDFIGKGIKQQFDTQDDAQFRGVLFSLMLANLLEDGGTLTLIEQYKEDNVLIHPEMRIFKFISIIPAGLIGDLIQ